MPTIRELLEKPELLEGLPFEDRRQVFRDIASDPLFSQIPEDLRFSISRKILFPERPKGFVDRILTAAIEPEELAPEERGAITRAVKALSPVPAIESLAPEQIAAGGARAAEALEPFVGRTLADVLGLGIGAGRAAFGAALPVAAGVAGLAAGGVPLAALLGGLAASRGVQELAGEILGGAGVGAREALKAAGAREEVQRLGEEFAPDILAVALGLGARALRQPKPAEPIAPAAPRQRVGVEVPSAFLTEGQIAEFLNLPKFSRAPTAMANAIANTGGATFNLREGNLALTKNFVVALGDLAELPTDKPTPKQIQTILARFAIEHPELAKDPQVAVGAYTADGKTFFELSFVHPEEAVVRDLAKAFNQRAAFDLGKLEEVPTGGSGDIPPSLAALPLEERVAAAKARAAEVSELLARQEAELAAQRRAAAAAASAAAQQQPSAPSVPPPAPSPLPPPPPPPPPPSPLAARPRSFVERALGPEARIAEAKNRAFDEVLHQIGVRNEALRVVSDANEPLSVRQAAVERIKLLTRPENTPEALITRFQSEGLLSKAEAQFLKDKARESRAEISRQAERETAEMAERLKARGEKLEELPRAPGEPLEEAVRNRIAVEQLQKELGTPHGEAAASVEEIRRAQTYFKVNRDGTISPQGKEAAVALRPGEALIEFNPRTGKATVIDQSGLGSARNAARVFKDQLQKIRSELGPLLAPKKTRVQAAPERIVEASDKAVELPEEVAKATAEKPIAETPAEAVGKTAPTPAPPPEETVRIVRFAPRAENAFDPSSLAGRTGIRGEELRRIQETGAPPRVNAYREGAPPEDIVVGDPRAAVAVVAEVPRSRIATPEQAANIRKQIGKRAEGFPGASEAHTRFEKAVIEAGFAGYEAPDGRIVLFEKLPDAYIKRAVAKDQYLVGDELRRVLDKYSEGKALSQQDIHSALAALERSLRGESFSDLLGKIFTETGAVGKLTPEQLLAEMQARAARRELLRRLIDRAKAQKIPILEVARRENLDPVVVARAMMGERIDNVRDLLRVVRDNLDRLEPVSGRGRIAAEQAEKMAFERGTVEPSSREEFFAPREGTFEFRFSQKDIRDTRIALTQATAAIGKTFELADQIRAFRDPFANAVLKEVEAAARRLKSDLQTEANRLAKLGTAAGRALKEFQLVLDIKDVLSRLDSVDSLLSGLKTARPNVLTWRKLAADFKRVVTGQATPEEQAQFGRDLVSAIRLNLFATTSFTFDVVGNAAELEAQLAGAIGADLFRVAQGKIDAVNVRGFLRAIRQPRRVPVAVEERLGIATAMGEPLARPFVPERPPASAIDAALNIPDYLSSVPIGLKIFADSSAKRFAAAARIWRDALEATKGLKGAARAEAMQKFFDTPPESTLNAAITEGNKAGFNRPLSQAEIRFAANPITQLTLEAYARWPFQFVRWASEMLGYNRPLFEKLVSDLKTGGAKAFLRNAEEIGRWLAKTATGIGGLYLIHEMLYDRVDFNTMEYVHPNGERTRLSSLEPIASGLFLLAILKGEFAKASGALRFASIPMGRAFFLEGGLIGGLMDQLAVAMRTAAPNPRAFSREITDILNRLIPGQAVLGAVKTLFDPVLRQGLGAGLPGVSLLLPARPNVATGEPLQPKQRLPIIGVEAPTILGTPVPGGRRIFDPVTQLLSSFGLLTTRARRLPIAGAPASLVSPELQREFEFEFGKMRQRMLLPLAQQLLPQIRANPALLQDPNFRDRMRVLIQQLDASAARLAKLQTEARRGGPFPRPMRVPTIRERRQPSAMQPPLPEELR